MTIPEDFHPLLHSTAVAFVSTIGGSGAPQVTPMWFVYDDHVQFSLVSGRQKLRNLQRDPRLAVLVVDPARPTFYIELRGHVEMVEDPELTLERRVSMKYTGGWSDGETPDTMRYAATVHVERVTSQRGHAT